MRRPVGDQLVRSRRSALRVPPATPTPAMIVKWTAAEGDMNRVKEADSSRTWFVGACTGVMNKSSLNRQRLKGLRRVDGWQQRQAKSPLSEIEM